MKAPVLLIAWRRPELTDRVLGAIRSYAPDQLFIACDGPNPERPEEIAKVIETRRVIEAAIDWPCTVARRYSDVNQGCKLGVSSAITWFFENIPKGIILEDDCLPHKDFFCFCEALLDVYDADTRVWTIGGCNFQDNQWRGDGSYYFSRYFHCWGWATWASRWRNYDPELTSWPALKGTGQLESIFEHAKEREYWRSIWDRLYESGKPDTWDYQWLFTCMTNSGLTALPNRNLVINIGFSVDATNCDSYGIAMNTDQPLDGINHPKLILRDRAADAYTFVNVFEPTIPIHQNFLSRKLRNAAHKFRLWVDRFQSPINPSSES